MVLPMKPCGRLAASAVQASRVGRCSSSHRPWRVPPNSYPSSYPQAAPQQPSYGGSSYGGAANNGPISLNAPGVPPDNEDEIELPPEGSPQTMRAPQQEQPRAPHGRYSSGVQQSQPPQDYAPQRLGPGQGNVTGSVGPVVVKPTATLACPIVSGHSTSWLAGVRAAGGDALVRHPRRRDQAEISAYSCRGMNGNSRAYLRTMRSATRFDISRLRARRWSQCLGEGRLEGHAGRAGLPARHPGRRVPGLQHRAGAGLQRLSLRSHSRGSDASAQAPGDLPAGGRVGRGDCRARAKSQSLCRAQQQ